MSIKIVISFEVESFDKMQSVFNAAENARTEAGIAAEIYRNIDATNNAWVIITAPSREAFTAFFSSPAQRERMRNAGVISPPIVTFLES
jgi:hypothetical protein